jgi:cell division protein FtsI/penicillin-binding protein 2
MTLSQKRRTLFLALGLLFVMVVVTGRLIGLQIRSVIAAPSTEVFVADYPDRGVIYDRNGAVLASNAQDYQIGASTAFARHKADEIAGILSPILNVPQHILRDQLTSSRPFVVLAGRVSASVAETIRTIPELSVLQIEPMPRRIYPQHELMCHTIGFANYGGEGLAGLEAYYNSELAGQANLRYIDFSPLRPQPSVIARRGADLVLTIDRSVQYLVEQHLQQALRDHGAESGTIIVMDPRSGALLAVANAPCFDPARFYDYDGVDFNLNPAIGQQFEPGSIMKLITMAAALDAGVVTPSSTYYDPGIIELGGHRIRNWDYSGPGTTDMTTLLSRSLNVGAATLAYWMGTDMYYTYMQRFNFGRPLGVDVAAEANGMLKTPGSSNWAESDLGTNSFGQGIATTPLQMVAATAALANEGRMMRPYLVQERHSQGQVWITEPTTISNPIRPQTAREVTTMAVASVQRETALAQVPGYTIAGKTGTAEIPDPIFGYHPTDTIGTFIGWLPADDPQLVILVKLDRPRSSQWGSQTAAPVFARLVQELVVLLDIPPDHIRLRAGVAQSNN